MGELHLPRKAMEALDRSFWQSIDAERANYLADHPEDAAQTGAKAEEGMVAEEGLEPPTRGL